MKNVFYRLFVFVFIIIFILTITALFLPQLVNTKLGKKSVELWINKQIPGSVEIKLIDLHWGKGQRIEGVFIKDPAGQSVITFEKIYTDASLWQLLKKSTQLGFTRIKDFNATLVIDENGQSNLQKAFGIQAPFYRTTPTTISLSDVQGDFYFTKDPSIPFSAHLKGITKEEDSSGSFNIDLILNNLHSEHWGDLKEELQHVLATEKKGQSKIDATVVHFPVEIIDQCLSLQSSSLKLKPLLGKKINFSLKDQIETNNFNLYFNLSTPFIQGSLKGIITEEAFFIEEPATFVFQPAASFIHSLFANSIFIEKNPSLILTLKNFKFPLKTSSLATTGNYSFELESLLSPAQVKLTKEEEMKVKQLQVLFSSKQGQDYIKATLKTELEFDEKTFHGSSLAKLYKPAQIAHLFTKEILKDLDFSLKIDDFPFSPPNAFIETVNLAMNLQGDQNLIFQGNLSLGTNEFFIYNIDFKIDDNFQITHPTSIPLSIDEKWATPFFYMNLFSPASKAVVKVHSFSFPLKDPTNLTTDLSINLEEIDLKTSPLALPIKIAPFDLSIKSESVWEWKVFITAQSVVANDTHHPFSLFFNSPTQTSLQVHFKIDQQSYLPSSLIKLDVKSDQANIKLEGALSPSAVFTYSAPAKIEYFLSPLTFQQWREAFDINPSISLVNGAKLSLMLNPISIDFKKNWLSKLVLKGEVKSQELRFKDCNHSFFSINHLRIPFSIDNRHNFLHLQLFGETFTSGDKKSNPLYGDLKMEDWFQKDHFSFDLSKTELSSHFIALPTSFISPLVFNHKDLSPLLGKRLDIELKTLFDSEKQEIGYWDMNIDSSTLHAKARLFLEKAATLYKSKNPTAIIRWKVTPEAYSFLKNDFFKELKGSLVEPFTITTHLSSLHIPLPFQKTSLTKGEFKALLSTSQIKLKDDNKVLMPLTVRGNFSSQFLSNKLIFENYFTVGDSVTKIAGNIDNLVTINKDVKNLNNLAFDLQFKSNELPLTYAKTLGLLSKEKIAWLSYLFGNKINIEGEGHLNQLSGRLKSEITGEKGKAKLDGIIDNGIFTLASPFTLSSTLSSEIESKKRVFFLDQAIKAEQPLQLIIEPEGFYCQLIPFKLEKLTVKKGSISTNRIHFLNQGELKNLFGYIAPIKESSFSIWFTPIYFHIDKQIFYLNRFDLLIANLYPLACWGKISLNGENMDLNLGLTASLLDQTFKITGLDPDYILQIPITRSKKGELQIDRAKVAKKMTTLLSKVAVIGKENWLGNLIKLAVEEPETIKAPPPTTFPFPWQTSKEENLSVQKSKEEKKEPGKILKKLNIGKKVFKKKKKEKAENKSD